jgi:hypothetical protein
VTGSERESETESEATFAVTPWVIGNIVRQRGAIVALTVRGVVPASVYRLLGDNENSATFALGWTLERSAAFRDALASAIFGRPVEARDVVITLQTHASDGGFTDLELQGAGRFHAILEAKRGWALPTVKQLTRYRPRIGATAKLQRLVSVSTMEAEQARRHLPADIDGVRLVHLSWRDVQGLANSARASATGFQEKLWLRELSWAEAHLD